LPGIADEGINRISCLRFEIARTGLSNQRQSTISSVWIDYSKEKEEFQVYFYVQLCDIRPGQNPFRFTGVWLVNMEVKMKIRARFLF
jgi:hypothetical protein